MSSAMTHSVPSALRLQATKSHLSVLSAFAGLAGLSNDTIAGVKALDLPSIRDNEEGEIAVYMREVLEEFQRKLVASGVPATSIRHLSICLDEQMELVLEDEEVAETTTFTLPSEIVAPDVRSKCYDISLTSKMVNL